MRPAAGDMVGTQVHFVEKEIAFPALSGNIG